MNAEQRGMQTDMNTNCLEGWKCPGCGQSDAFFVNAVINVLITDSGTEHIEGVEEHYDDETFCRCFDCDREGKVSDFAEKSVNA